MDKKILFKICIAVLISSPAHGQRGSTAVETVIPDTLYESYRLFEDDGLMEITLRFDLSTYWRTKPKKDYLKANITFHSGNSDSLSRDIRLRTRGEFRNQNCYFAPITLNFNKVDFGHKDLDSISKLKLVPECRTGGENTNYILREYLIYKMFSVLTDTSFRVRLLNINYIDTERDRKPIRQYGFFIEPLDMLTARTNTLEIKSLTLTQRNIVPWIMDRLAIFNYMIGNYDYSIPGQHNVKVIKPLVIDPIGLGIAVPYDFDWTGFVNASYAIPAENVGVETIRERKFQGICRSREVYMKMMEIFVEKKDEFYRVINEFPYLDKREKRDLTFYLDGFYDQLKGKSYLIDILLNTCKKI